MVIQPELLQTYIDASHDRNAWYSNPNLTIHSPFVEAIAPPILGILICLGELAQHHPIRIVSIRAHFLRPLQLEKIYQIHLAFESQEHLITMKDGGVAALEVRVRIDNMLPDLDIQHQHGFNYTCRPEPSLKLLHSIGLKDHFPISQLASLLWMGYRTGMINPGQRGFVSQFHLDFASGGKGFGANMEVLEERFDERTDRIEQWGNGFGVTSFYIESLLRPEPLEVDWDAARKSSKNAEEWAKKRIVITDALRPTGVGFASVAGLAGAEVVLNYRIGISKALDFERDLQHQGVQAQRIQADLANSKITWRMASELSSGPPIDLLILDSNPLVMGANLLDQGGDDWIQSISDSTRSIYQALKALIPCMAKGGQITLLSTEHLSSPSPGISHYLAAKAAQEALIQACSTEHPNLVFSVIRMPLSQATAAELPFEAANADENERWAGTALKQLGQIANRPGFHLLRVG
jgi:NAD(P)-dependent dehydrogenase (short-subunit alcohol dehydrogenase family)